MDAEEFAIEARRFCDYVETAHTLALEARARDGRLRLATLLAAACNLANGDVRDDDTRVPRATAPATWPGFADFTLYQDILEPFDLYEQPPQVGIGDLSDDFVDIYLDLRDGLSNLERNGPAAALWCWRFGFDAHWGAHAVDALRILNDLCGKLRV